MIWALILFIHQHTALLETHTQMYLQYNLPFVFFYFFMFVIFIE